MAFKLTKVEINRRGDHTDMLDKAKAGLISKIEDYNFAMAAPREALLAAINEFNDVLAEANQWRDDIHTRLSDEYENKSEKWQDGDRGREANTMIESWSNEIEGLDDLVDVPESLDIPDLTTDGEWFESYPDEVGQ
jgi:hypothetical protein